MKLTFKIFGFVFALGTAHASAQSNYQHCVAVYESATRNLHISEASYGSLNTIYDDYCEVSGEVKSSASSVGIEAVIKKVPFKFSGSGSNSKQKMKSFCKNYSNTRYESYAASELNNTVVVEALNAFNQCTEIAKNGVVVRYDSPTGLESSFSFQFGSHIEYELQGVQTGRNIKCSMQIENGSKTELVELDKASHYKSKKNFSAFCDRIPIENKQEDRLSYPKTNVTFASNHGNYSVVFPAEEVEGVQFASAIEQRVSGIESIVNALGGKVNKNKVVSDSADEEHSSRLGAIESKLSRKRLWGVNNEDSIYYSDNNGASWNKVNGKLKQITVGDGILWGVNREDKIYYSTNNGQSWTQVKGKLKFISTFP